MNLSFKEFEYLGWERVADCYDSCFGQITPQAASALVDLARVKPNDKVLDVACGPGYVARLVLKKGGIVTGIDFSSGMIQNAKIFCPVIPFQVMDAEKLEFADKTFDILLMNFGILHLAKPEQAIAEAFRVLNPRGKFIFSTWDQPKRSKAFDLILSAVQEEGDINVDLPKGPDFFQFADEIFSQEALSQAGFSMIESRSREFTWILDSSEALFQAFYQGGIRLGTILRAQKPESIAKILAKLELKAKRFQKGKHLEIPVSVMLWKAEKI